MHETTWRIEMLGGLQACSEGRDPIRLSRQQTGTLFAYLALNLNQAHSREHLAALIWPDDGPEEASHKLRQSLYALRRQLGSPPTTNGDRFLATRTSVQLDPTVFETDVMLFDLKVEAATKSSSNAERIRFLQEAMSLYRGELLPGYYLEEVETQRHRLAHQHRVAVQMLMRCYELAGDLERAIEAGNCALDLDPLVEETHCDLMRLYAAAGKPSAVIQQFQSLACLLKKELSAEPSEDATLLKESLLTEARLNSASSPHVATFAEDAASAAVRVDTGPALLPVPRGRAQPIRGPRNRPLYAVGLLGAVACSFGAIHAFGLYNRRALRADAPTHAIHGGAELIVARSGDLPNVHSATEAQSVRPTQIAPSGSHGSTTGGSLHLVKREPSLASVHNGPSAVATSKDTKPPSASELSVPSGTMLWNVRYKARQSDKTSEAKAVAVDAEHNIYVTGIVDTADHDVDFLTIKYDNVGHQIWEQRYNGPGNDLDRAVDIALDGKGGVYVTGESDNGKGNGATRLAGLDFATIKYDCNTGIKIWEQRYNGPDDGEDRPVRLKVDHSGVYVLGKSWRGGKSVNAGYGYALVKYGLDGTRQWVYRNDTGIGGDEPADMALARDGTIYVTGQSLEKPVDNRPELDILTLKISTEGKMVWEARYGFENHMDDWPCKIGMDRDENVYIIGTGRGLPHTLDGVSGGCITIKYLSTGGKPAWVHGTSQGSERIERAATAVVTESGEVAVLGTTHDRNGVLWARVVYRDENGSVRWNHDLCSLAGDDGVLAIVSAPKGVYLCGGLRESDLDVRIFSAGYGTYGNEVWSKYFGTPPCSGYANAIIADRDRMIVVGKYGDDRGHDFTVVCYQQ